MDVYPLQDGGLRFDEMPEAFYEQLSQLPEVCRPVEDEEVWRRLFPSPVDDEEDESVREAVEEDWDDFVRPEMEAAFDRALQTVIRDLEDGEASAHPGGKLFYQVDLPGDHVQAWFQVLNRARIVLALRYRLPLSEYPLGEGEEADLERLLAAQISDHYAEISEVLVHLMSRGIS